MAFWSVAIAIVNVIVLIGNAVVTLKVQAAMSALEAKIAEQRRQDTSSSRDYTDQKMSSHIDVFHRHHRAGD
jgi:cell division protein FtsL